MRSCSTPSCFPAGSRAVVSRCSPPPPGARRWDRGFAMARTLARAGLPWLGIALGGPSHLRPVVWEHALAALAEAVAKQGAICVVAAPSPLATPLAHAASLTLTCAAAGWQRAHGDV